METRKLIYKDLLNHNISQEELNQFLYGLFTIEQSIKSPVTELNEVHRPFHNNSACFSGAYCYAIAFNYFKIIQALLAAGADPNRSEPYQFGSPLILAVTYRKKYPAIFNLLLNFQNIDIYVTAEDRRTVFHDARGDALFVLNVLSRDPGFTLLEEQEKKGMSDTIAQASISGFSSDVDKAISSTIGKLYADVDDPEIKSVVETEINIRCCSPIGSIVSSYMFFHAKPASLRVFENYNLNSIKNNDHQNDDESIVDRRYGLS